MRDINSKFDPANEDSIQIAAVFDKLTGSSVTVGVGEEMTLGDITEGLAVIAMTALVEAVRAKGFGGDELEYLISMSGKIGAAYKNLVIHEQEQSLNVKA